MKVGDRITIAGVTGTLKTVTTTGATITYARLLTNVQRDLLDNVQRAGVNIHPAPQHIPHYDNYGPPAPYWIIANLRRTQAGHELTITPRPQPLS